MIDFWDRAWAIRAAMIHDYYREKERQRDKWKEYCDNTVQEILDDCVALTNALSELLKKQPGVHLHPCLRSGLICLPLYGFYLVQEGGKIFTKDQDFIVQSIFNSFRRDIPFSRQEYLEALTKDNDAKKRLFDLVEVTDDKTGEFWVQFFKLLYRIDADEEVLFEFFRPFMDLTMKFSVLGGVLESELVPILQMFYLRLKIQSIQCRNLPEDDLDLYGDKSYEEHFNEYKKEAYDVLNLTMDSDDEDLNPDLFFRYFTAGIIYQLISRCTRNVEDKVDITKEIFEQCGVPTHNIRDLYKFPNIPEDETTMFEWSAHVYTDPRGPIGWQMLIRGAATYAEARSDKDKPLKVTRAAINFLIGLENYLADKYQMSGFGTMAPVYCSYVVDLAIRDEVMQPNVDGNFKPVYSEPVLSIETMKERNDRKGVNVQTYINPETSYKSAHTIKSGTNKKELNVVWIIIIVVVLFILLFAVNTYL